MLRTGQMDGQKGHDTICPPLKMRGHKNIQTFIWKFLFFFLGGKIFSIFEQACFFSRYLFEMTRQGASNVIQKVWMFFSYFSMKTCVVGTHQIVPP